MTAPPSVSVVVMNRNYAQFVAEALESAVHQEPGTYRLAEVVVVDDGSTDGSRALYRRFPQVRVVEKLHEGFAATLTRAVDEASGDWFAPLDADDTFLPHKLRTVGPLLAQRRCLVVQHAEHVVDSQGAPYGEGLHPGGATSTLLVRTDAARSLLPVTNELFFHVLADLGHGVRCDDPLIRYRVHDESMTDRQTAGAFAAYMADVCAQVAARLDQLHDDPPWWASPEALTRLAGAYRNRSAGHREESRRQQLAAVADEGPS